MDKVKIGIVGYGNVGKGVELAIRRNPDMKLEAIFTRRNPDNLEVNTPDVSVLSVSEAKEHIDDIDVTLLCGGSKNDLPEQGPYFAQLFNTVDSFDTHNHIGPYIDEETHKKMQGYLKDVNGPAMNSNHTSAISIGWDPGTFSMERVLATSFLTESRAYAFYGLTEKGGLSMGHSDAARQVKGVIDARSYTHAIQEAISLVRSGRNPDLEPGDMHWRECFVVAEEGANKEKIALKIKKMPDYFVDYKTTVDFVSQEEMNKNHCDMPHDGVVIAVGETSPGKKAIIEYKCQWDSNPEATGRIMVAYARAVKRLNEEGKYGAITSLAIPPEYVSMKSIEELIKAKMV